MSKLKVHGLEGLLALNGDRYFIDDQGQLEVVFKVTRVAQSPGRPLGINYSLVLLNSEGERLVCFDNAHAVNDGSGPGRKRPKQNDHKHVGKRIVPYDFVDAHKLIADFWEDVDTFHGQ